MPVERAAGSGASFALTWADLIEPIATGTVVMAVSIWLWHQGLESLTTLDTGPGSLGLLTGLVVSGQRAGAGERVPGSSAS